MNDTSSRRAIRAASHRRQRGAVAVIFIVMAAILIGIGGFAIDFSRAFVMRNELQNAADAAALAGAGDLFRDTHQPDWARAVATAAAAVPRNAAEGTLLSVGDVRVGWWDLEANINPANPALPITWGTGAAPSTSHGALVEVRVVKDPANNGGPMSMTLGRLLGGADMPVSATAYAVVARPPSVINPGFVMPFAVSSCLFSAGGAPEIWDSANNRPVLPPVPFVIATGATHGSTKNCSPDCQCGQWTTFGESSDSASYLRDLLENGNAEPVSLDENTYIQPGTEATLYGTVQDVLAGREVTVPIVDESSLSTKGFTPVIGFACIRILAGIQGGNVNKVCSQYDGAPLANGGVVGNKCVIGEFSPSRCTVAGEIGGPSTYVTTVVPPRLVY